MIIVSNATPLVYLAKADLLFVLEKLLERYTFHSMLITEQLLKGHVRVKDSDREVKKEQYIQDSQ